MKKFMVVLGIAFALICGGIFAYSTTNADAVEQKSEVVEVSLSDAIEKYIETEQPEVDIVNVDVYDRSFDADHNGDTARYMAMTADGNIGFGSVRVESLADWYIQNA